MALKVTHCCITITPHCCITTTPHCITTTITFAFGYDFTQVVWELIVEVKGGFPIHWTGDNWTGLLGWPINPNLNCGLSEDGSGWGGGLYLRCKLHYPTKLSLLSNHNDKQPLLSVAELQIHYVAENKFWNIETNIYNYDKHYGLQLQVDIVRGCSWDFCKVSLIPPYLMKKQCNSG